MANFFKQIASGFSRPKVEFSNFDMSHEHKTTMQFGKLTPILCEEVLPGDKWSIDAGAFVRTMPLLSPMMHKVDLKVRFFFVPNRLIWDRWEAFIAGHRPDGQDLFVPSFFINGDSEEPWAKKYFGKGTLADYFGFGVNRPIGDSSVVMPNISQLPFRAYDCIYREYFANQWLNPTNVQQGYDGAKWYNKFDDYLEIREESQAEKAADLFLCEDVSYEPDYFTSCSPVPNATLHGITAPSAAVPIGNKVGAISGLYPTQDMESGITVPELRQALRLQEFLENTLHTGQRYIEQIFGHFGVESSDARLQRPEYLGGGSLAVQVSEVAATNESENVNLGDLAGRGLSVGSFPQINFTSEEHGYLFGIAYIVPHTSYYGGLPRTFMRRERFDYAWPEFATLGEQPVFQCELDSRAEPTKIFGYVPRYSEYKQSLDKFSGDMVDTLGFWHLGRNFAGQEPVLNENFVYIGDKQRKSLNRVFAETSEGMHPFQCSFGFRANAIRPLPFNPQKLG